MDAFSYLSVLLSIILGLALTQLLQGLRGIALHRARVVSWWPVLTWTGILMLVFVQSWWAMFGLRQHTGWVFVQFFTVILHTVLLYMLAALVLPDITGKETTDLRAHYFAQRRLFMLTLLATAGVSVLKDVVIDGRLPTFPNLGFHLGYLAAATIGLLTAREWYHKFLTVGLAVVFSLYILLLFSRLAG